MPSQSPTCRMSESLAPPSSTSTTFQAQPVFRKCPYLVSQAAWYRTELRADSRKGGRKSRKRPTAWNGEEWPKNGKQIGFGVVFACFAILGHFLPISGCGPFFRPLFSHCRLSAHFPFYTRPSYSQPILWLSCRKSGVQKRSGKRKEQKLKLLGPVIFSGLWKRCFWQTVILPGWHPPFSSFSSISGFEEQNPLFFMGRMHYRNFADFRLVKTTCFRQGTKRPFYKTTVSTTLIFKCGEGFPREGVGTKKFRMSPKPRETKLFGGISWDFCWDIPGSAPYVTPPFAAAQKFVFNSWPLRGG